jgi:predicted phosphodiesterase
MKLHILSDLHLEFAPFEPPATGADVVVLVGDIHTGTRGIAWARTAFPRQTLIYLAGNHEFYRAHWEGLLPRLRREAARHDVRFLENDRLEIAGVRFLGTSLWTDFDYFGPARRREAMTACVQYLADFHLIRASDAPDDVPGDDAADVPGLAAGLLTPALVRRRHLHSRAWLEAQLEAPWDGPTVVLTHHLPGAGSVAARFENDLGNAGFASHLDHLMGRAVLWVHGHTHDSFDYRVAGTRVLCNPRGYPMADGPSFENPQFAPGLVVDI